jgi:hypothetical protein
MSVDNNTDDTPIINQLEHVLKQKYSLINISQAKDGTSGYSIFENYDDMLLGQLQGISKKKTLIFIKDDDTTVQQPATLAENISVENYNLLGTNDRNKYTHVLQQDGPVNYSDRYILKPEYQKSPSVVGGKRRRTAKKSRSRRHRKTRK